MLKPGMQRLLDTPFDAVLAQLPGALGAEGFGVLSDIDVGQTLTKKLGVRFRRYRILGACNPGFAHEALGLEPAVGVLLPCNVAVYERDGGGTAVVAVDPLQSIGAFAGGDAQVLALAQTVKDKLSRVLAALT